MREGAVLDGEAATAGAAVTTGATTSLAMSEVTTRPPIISALNFNRCCELLKVTITRVADTFSALYTYPSWGFTPPTER